ncbi:hypothetical protein PLESTF_000586700 [Pleodorina starrii]|nr:hypothetical protein PLESTF_000586700 [Pleodorina starrii]
MALDAGVTRDRDQRPARGKWAGGTEVSCRGGPLNDDVQDSACNDAVMNVNFGGRTYSFEVQPGPDGYRRFTAAIREAFSLPEDSELNITFTCDEPNSGETRISEPVTNAGSLLTLQGAGAYDAAVHCASVSAARRISSGTPLAQAPIWPITPNSASGNTAGGVSAGGHGSTGGAAARRPSGAGNGNGASGQHGGAPVGASKPRGMGSLGRRLRNAFAELFGAGSSGAGGSSSSASGSGPGGSGRDARG